MTDSIPQEQNAKKCSKIKVLGIAPMLARAIARLHEEKSLSILFQVRALHFPSSHFNLFPLEQIDGVRLTVLATARIIQDFRETLLGLFFYDRCSGRQFEENAWCLIRYAFDFQPRGTNKQRVCLDLRRIWCAKRKKKITVFFSGLFLLARCRFDKKRKQARRRERRFASLVIAVRKP